MHSLNYVPPPPTPPPPTPPEMPRTPAAPTPPTAIIMVSTVTEKGAVLGSVLGSVFGFLLLVAASAVLVKR